MRGGTKKTKEGVLYEAWDAEEFPADEIFGFNKVMYIVFKVEFYKIPLDRALWNKEMYGISGVQHNIYHLN